MYRTSIALITLMFAGAVSADPVDGREADRPWVDPNNYQGQVLADKQGDLRAARIESLLEGRQGDRAVFDQVAKVDKPFFQQVEEARARGDYRGSK